MNATQEDRRLPLGYYPARLSDDDLDVLSAWGEKIRPSASALGRWLLGVVFVEVNRRELAEDGECREVDCPKLPFLDWSGNDLASALECGTALSYVTLSEEAAAFVDRLVLAINAAAATRLRSK